MKKSKRARASRNPGLALTQLRKKPLAVVIAMCCSGAALGAEPAAEPANDSVEEIVVTGLRQSLVTSEAIKRETAGVVDAITSEDIGKFPDTNLAEAIQRVPGVTIVPAMASSSTVIWMCSS